MLILFETAAGYAIFKLLNDKKLTESDNLYLDFQSPEAANKIVNLKYFHKFEDINEALVAITSSIEGKLCKPLKKTLKKHCAELHEELAVADAKLGSVIKDKLGLSCVYNTSIQELMRCIRSQMDGLLAGIKMKDMTAMRLGLAHNLSRYKLKFSPDKVDIMVTQAIKLLDELDKELNNYIMRCREWYGIHFPELGKIISDNMTYVRTVQIIGMRDNVTNCDLSDILSETLEKEVKTAAEFSMGTEMSDEDIICTHDLCTEIIELSQSRTQLNDYLKVRMMALAPNLSVLVGELIGARLMSHAGSLINLAKHPASTVQILGAEKALFRALKTKKNTPKYGLIYHSQLVGQSSKKIKGKMSRMLAAKASLATRFDALGESTNFDLGTEHRATLEARLRMLEENNIRRISGTAKAKAKFEKYHTKSEYFQYSASVDSTLQRNKPLIEETNIKEENEETNIKQENEETNKKKKKRKHSGNDTSLQVDTVNQDDAQMETKPDDAQMETKPDVHKKKKKKKHSSGDKVLEPSTTSQDDVQVEIKPDPAHVETESDAVHKKKKKRKHSSNDKALEISQDHIQAETNPDTTQKKKKKRSLSKSVDIGGLSGTQEAEIKFESAPKKKMKRTSQHTS